MEKCMNGCGNELEKQSTRKLEGFCSLQCAYAYFHIIPWVIDNGKEKSNDESRSKPM